MFGHVYLFSVLRVKCVNAPPDQYVALKVNTVPTVVKIRLLIEPDSGLGVHRGFGGSLYIGTSPAAHTLTRSPLKTPPT